MVPKLPRRVRKQKDGLYSLTPNQRITVEDVVRATRDECDGDMSQTMRLIADEQAKEILEEEYGITVSLARIRRVA